LLGYLPSEYQNTCAEAYGANYDDGYEGVYDTVPDETFDYQALKRLSNVREGVDLGHLLHPVWQELKWHDAC